MAKGRAECKSVYSNDFFQGNGYINVSDLREILRALDDNVSVCFREKLRMRCTIDPTPKFVYTVKPFYNGLEGTETFSHYMEVITSSRGHFE